METKITTANIRIALSFNYSTFEITAQLENQDGINNVDINAARQDIQALASHAVEEYKRQLKDIAKNPQKAIDEIQDKLLNLKSAVPAIEDNAADPEEVKKVEALPMYGEQPKISGTGKKVTRKK